MNTSLYNLGLIALSLLLLVSFVPWGNRLWGWSGLFEYSGHGMMWMSGWGGWLVNILLMVLIGLGIIGILMRLQRSERRLDS